MERIILLKFKEVLIHYNIDIEYLLLIRIQLRRVGQY